MFFSEDSSDLVLERVNSNEKPKPYTVVPWDTVYVFKFKDENMKSYALIEYLLKEGKDLPLTVLLKGVFCTFLCDIKSYIKQFLGKSVSFSKFLSPTIVDMRLLSENEETRQYVFQDSSFQGSKTKQTRICYITSLY